MVEHVNIPDADLHEPKGVASANAGEVYVADGLGSGSWSPRVYILSGVIADVSTAETVYLPVPYSGNVVKITTVLEGAISASDATVTLKDNAGTTMGTVTITQSGSASGDTDSNSSLSNNSVGDNDFITVETDGGSTDAQSLWFNVVVERDS